MHLRLDPQTSAEQVEVALDTLRQIVKDSEILGPTCWVAFDKIGHGFLELEFWFAIKKWAPAERELYANEYVKVCAGKSRVNLEILRRFRAAGITLAIPLEAHLKVEPWRERVNAEARLPS